MLERLLLALSWVNLVVLAATLAYNVLGGWLTGR